MLRRRTGFTLLILAGLAGTAGLAEAEPLHNPQAEVLDRLAPAMATHDPARLTMAFRAMGEYALPAAIIVEATVNNCGYQYLQTNQLDAAISAFELNVETFPGSANAWDSLADANLAKGDHAMAIRFYNRSLELDPENHNAALKLRQLQREAPGRLAG